MKYVVFENDGELDLAAITTFGCSVKETSNPIGFFGTGLKYALAVLMRLGQGAWIQTGDSDSILKVQTSPLKIRGKDFDALQVGDTACGFTTELGKNWKAWMAYRELYCNAKDEKNWRVYEVDSIPMPETGKTRVIVEGNDILQTHRSRTDFMLETEPIFVWGDIEVHARASTGFFYKGVRVMEFEKPCLFTYNVTSPTELTEDRTVKSPYEIGGRISRAILGHAGREQLKKILVCGPENMEHFFDYHGWSTTPGPDFFPTISELQRDQSVKINNTAIRLWREKGDGYLSPRRANPTPVQAIMLERALEFCERIGFNVRGSFPIIVVESLGQLSSLAAADTHENQIFLTQMLFDQDGTKGVARALIEEYIHLRHKITDESREMQNLLFAKMVSLGEQIDGKPL